MRYQELPVSPALARHVEALWVLEDGPSPSPRAPRPIYPDGRLEMVLNLGDPTEELGPGGATRQARALLGGQLSGPLRVATGPRVFMLGIRFRPEGALAFAGVPLPELADRVVPLDDLGMSWAGDLVDRLQEVHPGSAATAAALVEETLLARVRPSLTAPPAIRAAVRALQSTAGRLPMDALGRLSSLSPRELQRGFRRHVGISPKRLARILRFQEALRLSGLVPWVEVALRCGYFDQAHLVRDFRELAGETPVNAVRELEGLSEVFSRRVSLSSKTGRADASILGAEVKA